MTPQNFSEDPGLSPYRDGFLDAMFAVRDLVEEWLPEDPQSFETEFWALCEEVTHESRND